MTYDPIEKAKSLSIAEKRPYMVYHDQDDLGNWGSFYMPLEQFDNYYQGVETGDPYPYNNKEICLIENGQIVEEY